MKNAAPDTSVWPQKELIEKIPPLWAVFALPQARIRATKPEDFCAAQHEVLTVSKIA